MRHGRVQQPGQAEVRQLHVHQTIVSVVSLQLHDGEVGMACISWLWVAACVGTAGAVQMTQRCLLHQE